MIYKEMSIPEFLDTLDLCQLALVAELTNDKITKIRDQNKVKVYVSSSGVINEGFYRTEEEALEVLKSYVNSKEFSVHDRVRVHSILQFQDEADRLVGD